MNKNTRNTFTWAGGLFGILVVAGFSLFSPVETHAANPTVTLRIADETATILNTTIIVPEGCDVEDGAGVLHTFVSSTALCAIEAAKDGGLLTYHVTDFGFGLLLDQINDTANASDWSRTWIFRENSALSNTGLDQTLVGDGDEILLAFGPWDMDPLALSVTTATVTVGESITLSTLRWSDEGNQFETWTGTTTFSFSTGETVESVGIFAWTPNTAGSVTVVATTPGAVSSPTVTITVEALPPPRPITLRIETVSSNLLTAPILLPESCVVTDSALATHTFADYAAICALQQAKEDGLLTFAVTDWGFAFALDQINNIANAADWSETWLMYHNLLDPGVGIDGFSLQTDDELLLTYGSWPSSPLGIEVSTTTVAVGDSITVTATPSATNTTTFWFNSETTLSTSSSVVWIPETAETVVIFVEAEGMTRTKKITLIVQGITSTQPEIVPVGETPQPSSSGSGNLFSAPTPTLIHAFDIDRAIDFLSHHQNPDGSFGGSVLFTDWAAIAIGAARSTTSSALFDTMEQRLISYLVLDPSPHVAPNKTANAARRAMALLALGLDPATATQTNYIAEILNGFDGTQFGDSGLVNDDIFALFPLIKTGYTVNDAPIAHTVSFLLAKQEENGSWGSVDLTAAGMQVLSLVHELPGVSTALEKATQYLKMHQEINGGFGNVYTTSWALQAIAGQPEDQWTTTLQKTPASFLGEQQAEDGGLPAIGESDDNRIWATSYAIPAILKKPWGAILASFGLGNPEKTTEQESFFFGQGGSPEIIDASTSTVHVLLEKEEDAEKIIEEIAHQTESTEIAFHLDIQEEQTTPSADNSLLREEPIPIVDEIKTIVPEPKPESTTISAKNETTVPIQKTARGVFAGAASLAGSLGIYLVWRLAQTIV